MLILAAATNEDAVAGQFVSQLLLSVGVPAVESILSGSQYGVGVLGETGCSVDPP